jgi:hypothetical protein
MSVAFSFIDPSKITGSTTGFRPSPLALLFVADMREQTSPQRNFVGGWGSGAGCARF